MINNCFFLILANRKPIFTPEKHGLEGFLDGQTIDTDGNLWCAMFNGSCVIKVDPRKPETLLQVVKLPAKQVCNKYNFSQCKESFCFNIYNFVDNICSIWRSKFG